MLEQKKKNKGPWILVLLLLIVMAGAYLGVHYWKQYRQMERARRARYAFFGIDIPVNYSIHGIDISSHQEFIHWPAVKAMKLQKIQVNFVFIKATEGLNDADKQFKYNWAEAKKDSITRGAYHFFLATKSGKAQAENFMAAVKLNKGDLPPVLDIEELYGVSPDAMRARVLEFLEAVEARYKLRPVIYTYLDFYEKFLGKDFDEYPLWVANYDEKLKPKIKRNWLFWQHSDRGRVNGITTGVDFDVFAGDSTDFKGLLAP